MGYYFNSSGNQSKNLKIISVEGKTHGILTVIANLQIINCESLILIVILHWQHKYKFESTVTVKPNILIKFKRRNLFEVGYNI